MLEFSVVIFTRGFAGFLHQLLTEAGAAVGVGLRVRRLLGITNNHQTERYRSDQRQKDAAHYRAPPAAGALPGCSTVRMISAAILPLSACNFSCAAILSFSRAARACST